MLFEPIQVGTLEIPNRIVMAPMGTNFAEPGGAVSDTLVNHYARRAEGGAGLVVVELSMVDDRYYKYNTQLRISNDRLIPGLRRLARAIKARGARAAIQLQHYGRMTSSGATGLQPIAPSPIPAPASYPFSSSIQETPREMSLADIEELIELFAGAAARAREAGFDAVQLHGAHGYLLCQFMSRSSNQRSDEYGGDLAGRARFTLDIIRRCKERAGRDFPVILRFSGEEHVPDGIVVEESREIARLAVAAGADAIDVSAGSHAALEWSIQPQFWPRACLAPLSAVIKPAIRVPVSVAGRINDAAIAERILRNGQADMVAMGRALLADPDLPRKALAGSSQVHRCIACNTCLNTVGRISVRCLINPELGSDGRVEQPAEARRRVLVVGAGPSGMEAARIARLRGHEVALWERQAKSGGRWAYMVGGFVKDRLQRLRDLGVELELGRDVSLAAITAASPDVVLATQRLVPRPAPFVPAGSRPLVVSADELLDEGAATGARVAILGGDTVGCEAAQALLAKGSAVTMVSFTGMLGEGIEAVTAKVLLERLRQQGLGIVGDATSVRSVDGALALARKEGEDITLVVDTVVVALGYERDEGMVDQLREAGFDARALPACEAPTRASDAMADGASVARTV